MQWKANFKANLTSKLAISGTRTQLTQVGLVLGKLNWEMWEISRIWSYFADRRQDSPLPFRHRRKKAGCEGEKSFSKSWFGTRGRLQAWFSFRSASRAERVKEIYKGIYLNRLQLVFKNTRIYNWDLFFFLYCNKHLDNSFKC